ncbi:MAG TPA: DUF6569 family protein [bacterium]|nr:DUF6569 family protein [bacterium]
MNVAVREYLARIRTGPVQSYKRLAVVPLFAEGNGGPDYMTLSEAMSAGVLIVTEMSAAGRVPELFVENTSDRPILLLDGEEVAGAKQNRVLNTSVLLKGKSKTLIPVSCTEQGRWHYTSSTFADSGVVMSPRMRARKMNFVTRSVRAEGLFLSDQGDVWRSVAELAHSTSTMSPTRAMRDTFAQRANDLQEYVSHFRVEPGQNGMLVFVAGEPMGFDALSRPEAFATLAPKLLRSAAMEALAVGKDDGPAVNVAAAEAFLRRAAALTPTPHPSIGLGEDWRFEGDDLVGSALVVEGVVIHTAFFRALRAAEGEDHFPSLGRRRGFRSDRP